MNSLSTRIIVTGANSELASSLVGQAILRPGYSLLLISRKPQRQLPKDIRAEAVQIDGIDLTREEHLAVQRN